MTSKYHAKVISLRQDENPAVWKYWDCGTPTSNPIRNWHDRLSLEAKDKLNALLKDNAKIENTRNWGGFKHMQGALKEQKIWQLSISDSGGQVRLLGITGSKRKHAIFLIGCFHKEKVYTPPSALETAVTKAKAFKNGMVQLYDRQSQTDL